MYKTINCGENNVELWELKETKTDIKGDSFEVWEKVKSYGKDVVEEELKSIDARIDELNPAKMSSRIAELQKTKKTILGIKTILDEKPI